MAYHFSQRSITHGDRFPGRPARREPRRAVGAPDECDLPILNPIKTFNYSENVPFLVLLYSAELIRGAGKSSSKARQETYARALLRQDRLNPVTCTVEEILRLLEKYARTSGRTAIEFAGTDYLASHSAVDGVIAGLRQAGSRLIIFINILLD